MTNALLLVGLGFVAGLLLAPIVVTAYSAVVNRITTWGRNEVGDE